MKVLMLTLPERIARYSDPADIPSDWELVYMGAEKSDAELLSAAADADFIFADAVRPVSGELIRSMPGLKLIHSEGAGFNAIDVAAARERGIAVCNCPGMNASAVAEQTVLLMLGVLRKAHVAHEAVLKARQIEFKLSFSQEGIPELGDKTVGFVGFGAIARQTARLLKAFGCIMYCYNRSPVPEDVLRSCGVSQVSLEQLYAASDIVSLHVPVTAETTGMINAGAIAKMKDGVIIINTARGDVVCQEDLAAAVASGKVGGIGLDVYSPEPVREDNPLLYLPQQAMDRVIFSPHIGGITTKAFTTAHRHIWKNLKAVAEGKPPMTTV